MMKNSVVAKASFLFVLILAVVTYADIGWGEAPPSFLLKIPNQPSFNYPRGVAAAPDGSIWVADNDHNQIVRFYPDNPGAEMRIGSSTGGSGDGQFNQPYGVAVDSSGNVYVADSFNNRIQKFTGSGGFVTKWGALGSGDGQFLKPFGVAVDSSGNVYVADSFNNRIQKFTGSGGFVTKWGAPGSGDGQLNFPNGVVVDSSGNVYVSDTNNYRIQKFTNSGGFITKWSTASNVPLGIAVDSSGNVYVTFLHYVKKFTGEGILITQWGSYGTGDGQFSGPNGVVVDSSGNVYVSDTNNYRIQKFTNSGSFITKYGTFGSGDGLFNLPRIIAVDSPGNVYVADTDNHRIQKFTGEGVFITKWGSNGSGDGQFKRPHGVAVDNSGNVYVADSENHRIQKFTDSGGFVTKWGALGSGDGQFNYPTAVAVDSSGNVFVIEAGNRRIQKFTSTGGFITKWGAYGSGDGQFYEPYGVAVDISGNVYVADTKNNRVQKFTGSGDFITKWGTLGSGDGQFYWPYGVAVDSSGDVYVTDLQNNRIQKFTNSGGFITKWGALGSGDGQLNWPTGVATDSSENVYVADYNNHRIQKFSCYTYYRDFDGDGYGDPNNITHGCLQPPGYVTDNTDCDDSNSAIHPGATEVCNGEDDNCDGQIDEGLLNTYYQDLDGDTYGNPLVSTQACTQPPGYVTNNLDCDDSNFNIKPGAAEICDGKDNDCDGQVDEGGVCGVSDLIVTTVTGPTTGLPGSTITVGDTTKNNGPNNAPSSITKFYWSTNSTLDAGDAYLGARAVPSLAVGATNKGTITVTVPSGACSGTFYIIAKADADNLIPETNENNNTKSKSIKTGPDLIVSTVTAPLTSGAGKTISVTDTTKNQGGCPAVASTTKLYFSTNSTWDAGDTYLGERAIPALAAGETNTGSTSVTIPAEAATGTRYIIAKADANAVVTETSETNNKKSKSIKIGPDLIVSLITAPTRAARGSAISITDTTKNSGGGDAGASTTKLYLSTNTTWDAGDAYLGSRSVPLLAAGASSAGSTSVTIPSGITTGPYYIIVLADDGNAVAETNETNNKKTKAITIN